MTAPTITRPKADEHAPYYAKYIERVPDGNIVALLRDQLVDTTALLRRATSGREDYAYAAGKWTVKEVVGHVIDVERVMGYRALSIARNDPAELPGFDENAWVANANFGVRTLADLVEELQGIRASTVHFAKHLDGAALARRGVANHQGVSVRALLYIIAGHERHHAALLRERYLQD
jgi:hypothetical protein